MLDTHFHFHGDSKKTNKLLKQILMNQTELKEKLEALTSQAQKSNAEIQAKLQELADAIATQGNTSPDVDAALANLTAVVKANDELIADATGEEPSGEEPTV